MYDFIFYIAVIVGVMGKCDTFTATSGLYRDARQHRVEEEWAAAYELQSEVGVLGGYKIRSDTY